MKLVHGPTALGLIFIAGLASPVSGAALGPVDLDMVHASLDQRIGYPAIIEPGGAYPEWVVRSAFGGTLAGELVCMDTGSPLHEITPRLLTPDEPLSVSFEGALPAAGTFQVGLRIRVNEAVVFRDAYYFSVLDPAALPETHSLAAHPGPDGTMRYIPDVRGNRIPDFSGVGYRGGATLPHAPTVLTLEPAPGDATERIQAAIDEVSARPPDAAGFRGAITLKPGLYEIADRLRIAQSGVVLRGAGPGDARAFLLDPAQGLTLDEWRNTMAATEATILVATGPERRVLLTIAGPSGITTQPATATEIVDAYVPVGARSFHVADPAPFAVGDTILLERRGNADWISYIKMDQIPPRSDGGNITQWPPFNLQYEYVIKAIDDDRITIDSGLVNAVEQRWGGGRILRYAEGGRIQRSGVENLRAVSFWTPNQDGVDDTRHADRFLVFDRIRDGWARDVVAEHFTGTSGAFSTGRESLGITIEDCSALVAHPHFYSGPGYDPSGRTFYETGVYVGRYGFYFGGQNGLVRRCYTVHSRHAFTVNSRVTGPNVFSDCLGANSLSYSEPHHRWSTGGLYDNVTDTIALMNRLNSGSGHGWAGANYVAWNTTGDLRCEQPPTAQNWAIGHVGRKLNGPFHSWNMHNYGWSYGYWESVDQPVEPTSLYEQQWAEQQARRGVRLQKVSLMDEAVLPTSIVALDVSAEIGTELEAADLVYEWRTVSGPGRPVFSPATGLQTTVVLDTPGVYVAELWIWSTTDPAFEVREPFTLTLHPAAADLDTTGGAVQIIEEGARRYRIHTYTETGPDTFEVLAGTGEIELLVVGGGGGGGGSSNDRWGGGGGGAGGLVETRIDVTPGIYSVRVGDGGKGGEGSTTFGEPGEDSYFGDWVALGGGPGRGQNNSGDGGSGSGGAPLSSEPYKNAGGLGLQPTSSSGGFGYNGGEGTGVLGADRAGGGGGGAGGPGGAAAPGTGGDGGHGRGSAISGTWTIYAGGGGGAGRLAPGEGGDGGGGNGGLNANGRPGTRNTGGGGGASSLGNPHRGGDGGSGIVIVRVRIPGDEALPGTGDTKVSLGRTLMHDLELRWLSRSESIYLPQVSADLVRWQNTGALFQGSGDEMPMVYFPVFNGENRAFFRLLELP